MSRLLALARRRVVRRTGPAELVTIPDAWPAGQDGVQVIVDRQVASGELVGVAGGQPGDEPGRQGRFGAAAGL